MKIVILINSLAGGGAENVARTLANHFHIRKHCDVTIVTLTRNQDWFEQCGVQSTLAYPLESGVQVRCLDQGHGARGIIGLPWEALKFARLVRELQPNVVVSFLVHANLVNILSRLFGNTLPTLLTEHNTTANVYRDRGWKGLALLWLIRRMYRRASGIVAVSAGVKEGLQQLGIPASLITVIHNPITITEIQKQAALEPAVPLPSGARIVSAGSFTHQKDHDTLLRAFAEVRREVPAELILLGDGPLLPDTKRLAQRLEVDRHTHFMGWQANPFAILARSNLFVLSSRFEGFGIVIIEALACALPVVSTDCPSGPREILEGQDCGELSPVGNPGALAAAMLRMLHAPGGAPGRAVARARDFDVEQVAQHYCTFLNRWVIPKRIRAKA